MRGRWSAISLFYFPRRKGMRGMSWCILESERLILRPPGPSDVPAMAVWLGDYDVAKMTSRVPHPYGEARCRGFRRAPANKHRFAIQRKDDGLFMGMIGLHPRRRLMSSAIGWASRSGAGAMPPKRRARLVLFAFEELGPDRSMPAGFTTIRPRAMCWPSWGRAIMAAGCAIAGPGATRFCAMRCC